MVRFSAAEIRQIDQIWRGLPADHSWSGWAAVDVEPSAVWLYRQRANWRRFLLTKQPSSYALSDDLGHQMVTSNTLTDILCDIENIPGLSNGMDT